MALLRFRGLEPLAMFQLLAYGGLVRSPSKPELLHAAVASLVGKCLKTLPGSEESLKSFVSAKFPKDLSNVLALIVSSIGKNVSEAAWDEKICDSLTSYANEHQMKNAEVYSSGRKIALFTVSEGSLGLSGITIEIEVGSEVMFTLSHSFNGEGVEGLQLFGRTLSGLVFSTKFPGKRPELLELAIEGPGSSEDCTTWLSAAEALRKVTLAFEDNQKHAARKGSK